MSDNWISSSNYLNNTTNTSTYSNDSSATLANHQSVELVDNYLSMLSNRQSVTLVDNWWLSDTLSVASNSNVTKKLDDIKHAINSNQNQLVQIKHTISALMSSYLLTLNNNIKNMGFNSYSLFKIKNFSSYDAYQLKSFYPFICDVLRILFSHNGERIFKDYDCIAACDRGELLKAMSDRCVGVVYMSMILKTDVYGHDDSVRLMLQKQFVDCVFADKQWKKLLAVSIPIPLDDHQLVHIMSQKSNVVEELANDIEQSYFGKIIISTNMTSEKDNSTELAPVFWSYSIDDIKRVLKDMDKKLNSRIS